MTASSWGTTLLIANPTAYSGNGRIATQQAEKLLRSEQRCIDSLDVYTTRASGDGYAFARSACNYDTILVLGGDGIIHEVANGILNSGAEHLPRLGVIPVGSGNDYARTLQLPINNPQASIETLARSTTRLVDVGKVNDTYFVQTLSFGLDAAIALDTSTRRSKGTRQKGTGLFVTSGMRIFSQHHNGWSYRALFNKQEGTAGDEIIFAVQVGSTYGGGFKICPKASPTDGLLDVCHNVEIPPIPAALILFGLARTGLHVGAKSLRFRQIEQLSLSFDEEPPVQVDGEPLHGTEFHIQSVPRALRVICPL